LFSTLARVARALRSSVFTCLSALRTGWSGRGVVHTSGNVWCLLSDVNFF
jgi:hypothetical protein